MSENTYQTRGIANINNNNNNFSSNQGNFTAGSGAQLGEVSTPDVITEHQNTEIISEGKAEIFEDITPEVPFNWEDFRELSPLENQISKPIFDREYLIYDEPVAQFVETVIQPYAELVNRPEIKDMLHAWIYSRFDLEVTVKCITPAKSYGIMIGSWQPFKIQDSQGEDYYPETTPEDWMTDENAFYLSYGEAESITIPINWTGPLHYIRHMHKVHDLESDKNIDVERFRRLGKLVLKNLGYRSLDTASPLGNLQVFVRAKNPVLQGPRLPGLFGGQESGQPQSQIVPANPVVRGALALGTAGGVSTALASVAYGSASNFFNQVLTYTSKNAAESTVNAFANKLMTTSGMKKTEDNKSTRNSVKFNPMGEMSMIGYDNREEICTLADKPGNMKIPERLVSRSNEDFNIYELCRRWAYLGNTDLSLGAAVAMDANVFPARQGTGFVNRGYVSYLARCFRCWSGDLEFKIVIPANALIMGRIQISLFWGDEEWTGMLLNQSTTDKVRRTGPLITKTFDIRGTTEFEFLVPYLYEYPMSWVWNTDRVSAPVVLVDHLVAPNDGSTLVPIEAHVFFRAGKNFRFYHPCDPLPKYQALPEGATPQGRIQSPTHEGEFEEISSPEYSPYDHLAFHGTILDLCSRWSPHVGADESFPLYVSPDMLSPQAVDATYSDYGTFGYLSMLYGFYSGEIERKSQLLVQGSLSTTNESMVFLAMDMYPGQSTLITGDRLANPTSSDGMQLVDTSLWRTLEYAVPYMSRYQLAPIQSSYWRESLQSPLSPYLTNPEELVTPAIANKSAFWRPGKNFCFHVLYPPLGPQHFVDPTPAFNRNTIVTPPISP